MPSRRGSRALFVLLAAVCITYARIAAAGVLQTVLEEQDTWKVALPKGTQPEGIAAGSHNDLWVACLSGNIIHVDLNTNTSTIVHKESHVYLSGAKFCRKQQLLFVAGTLSGKAYVYHMQRVAQATGVGSSSETYSMAQREVLDLDLPGKSYINDVALSNDRAYFTDSFNPVLYWVPRFGSGGSSSDSSSDSSSSSSGSSRPVGRVATGPYFDTKAGQFRANGIAVYKSNERKDTLLVANTHTGNLYRVEVDKAPDAAAPEGLTGGIAVAAAKSGVKQLSQQATMAVASRLRKARGSAGVGTAAAGPAAGTPAATTNSQSTKKQQPKQPKQASVVVAAKPSKDHPPAGAAADGAAGGDIKWSKLAQEVASEMQVSARRKRLSQAAVATSQYLTRLAHDVSERIQSLEADTEDAEETEESEETAELDGADEEDYETSSPAPEPAVSGARARPAAAAKPAAAEVTHSGAFTAKPSADKIVHAGHSKADATPADASSISHSSRSRSSSWQPPAAQADPVAIHEPKQDVNAAVQAAAAAVAAAASTATRHGVRLGRSLRASTPQASETSWQQPLLLADPVKIPEQPTEINAAVMTAAAVAAASAATTTQHRVRLGRNLQASVAEGAQGMGWPMPRPGKMARSIANRLGLAGRGKQQIAQVVELQLPAIAGRFTKRLLVDGIAIKNETAYVADNYNNRVWGVELEKGAASARLSCGLQGPAVMHVPTTLAFQLGRLWWLNAHLDTCFPFLPCPQHTFELHGVRPAKCEALST